MAQYGQWVSVVRGAESVIARLFLRFSLSLLQQRPRLFASDV
jgi:hypothetical protein